MARGLNAFITIQKNVDASHLYLEGAMQMETTSCKYLFYKILSAMIRREILFDFPYRWLFLRTHTVTTIVLETSAVIDL